jgi:type I restriction enzyme, S subunit
MIPDGWQLLSLENIATVERGKFSVRPRNDPRYYGGKTPFVQTGDVVSSKGKLDCYSQTLNEEGVGVSRVFPTGTILVTIAANIGDVALTQFEVAIPDSIVAVNANKKANTQWLFQYLITQKEILDGLATQNAQKNINLQVLRPLQILVPPLLEQCRIAEVLGVWDESIDLLERLIGRVRSRKQGLMQQLLTGRKRFKEFEDSEWKRYHFKDIFKRITRKNTVNNSNILTISGTHGLINQRDFFNKRVAADNLDGYYLIEKGEFAYNKSYSNGYPLGAIKRLDRYDAGVLSTLYICFGLSNSLNSGDFMAHYFESGIFNKEIYGIAQEGARNHGLLNIGVNDFFELLLRIPSLPEQEKIAAVLSAADEEISTLEKQLAAYKQQKLGLMQQLLTGRIRI